MSSELGALWRQVGLEEVFVKTGDSIKSQGSHTAIPKNLFEVIFSPQQNVFFLGSFQTPLREYAVNKPKKKRILGCFYCLRQMLTF